MGTDVRETYWSQFPNGVLLVLVEVEEALAEKRRRLPATPAHLPATCRAVARVADKFGYVPMERQHLKRIKDLRPPDECPALLGSPVGRWVKDLGEPPGVLHSSAMSVLARLKHPPVEAVDHGHRPRPAGCLRFSRRGERCLRNSRQR